jgi:hypothetical protein
MSPLKRISAVISVVCLNIVLLAGKASALEIDAQAFQHHPVRMTIGIVTLVLSLILLIYVLIGPSVRQSKKNKSYGSGGRFTGLFIPSYKKGSGNDKRYGKGLLGLFFPSYKGGKSSAGNANLRSNLPMSYKESWGSQKRYGKFHFGVALPFYRGGKSVAGESTVPTPHRPSSLNKRHQGPKNGWQGMLPNPSYKGGKSSAASADLRGALPMSYKESWGNKKRYGSFQFGVAIPSYRKSKSSAGEGVVPTPHRPASHSKRYQNPKNGWQGMLPNPSYKGGKSSAASADLRGALPMSYKESWGSQKRYGNFQFGVAVPSYKTGKSAASAAHLSNSAPASYHGGWAAAGEAAVPLPHRPSSHNGRRGNKTGLSGWKPAFPVPSYKGGFNTAKGAVPGTHNPNSHSGFRLSSLRFGFWRPDAPTPSYKGGFNPAAGAVPNTHSPNRHTGFRLSSLRFGFWRPDAPTPSYKGGFSAASAADLSAAAPASHRAPQGLLQIRYGQQPFQLPLPSYKGGFSAAKAARVSYHSPQSYRRGFARYRLSGKNWVVPVDSYKGGYSIAGTGRPIQELPRSYREPWGSKRRYGAVPILPIRMDGSPTPQSQVVVEPPMSYKEPWGSKARYGRITAIPTPIRMDGSPVPQSRVVVEPPMSYKESWGSQKRYGKDKSIPAPEKHYYGGSTTNAKAPWQNPETGEVYMEHLSNAKRYGNSRYGGKLYAPRSCKHFQKKSDTPIEESTLV